MLIEGLCITGTIAAIAGSEINDRYFKWKTEWNNLMIDNKLDNYRAIERTKTIYGYKYIINIKSLSYDKLDKIKDIVESHYNCQVEMEKSETNRSAAVIYLITNPPSDSNSKFKPYRTKPYQIYVSLDNKYTPITIDLNKYPHALISGTTGSGKTEQVRTILTNMIANYTSRDIEIYFSDLSDMCDYEIYKNCKQVKSYAKDIYNSVILFNHIMHIYKKRLSIYETNGTKNIKEYNEKCNDKHMSYIYIVCDEFADYYPSDKNDKEYEAKVQCYEIIKHLLRKARKVGIFMIIGIQRPDTSVLDPSIKSLLCTKIGFTQNNSASSLVACDTTELTNVENRIGLAMFGNRRDWFRSIYIDDNTIQECISGSIENDHKDILFNKSEVVENCHKKKYNQSIKSKTKSSLILEE